MVTFPVSFPDDIKLKADARAKAAGFASLSEYLAALIAAGGDDRLDPGTERALMEGLSSPGREVTRADWDAKVRAFEARMSGGADQ